MRNISAKIYFKIGPLVQVQVLFKYISVLALVGILFRGSEEQNRLCRFGTAHFRNININYLEFGTRFRR